MLTNTILFAQNDYSSLLWKIEGNNLEKASYLYGTMHVSKRIAFHLSDVFYEKLLSADKIALESNPEMWLEASFTEEQKYSVTTNTNTNAYDFTLNPVGVTELQNILMMDHAMLNNLLYRSSEEKDFEEDTYLDMYIYQAGKKYNKEIVSLEHIIDSQNSVQKALTHRTTQKNLPQWLMEKFESKSYANLLEEAYRDQNLNLLDSINRYYYTRNYNEYMLYDRNKIMVEALDSIMPTGSLFVGVGAAHLPGKEGLIELLRAKGYRVTPLKGTLTQKGKRLQSTLEKKFLAQNFSVQQTSDKFISLQVPSRLYEFGSGGQTLVFSADYANGGYVNIVRMNRFNALISANEKVDIYDLGKIYFENISGTILDLQRTQISGYKALDIQHKTADGNHLRTLIIETPLEIIVIRIGGNNNYALRVGQMIRDHIELKQSARSDSITAFSPFYGGYNLRVPQTYIATANSFTSKLTDSPIVQAFDTLGNYYFLMEKVYNDLNYFEEDSFESTYILTHFLEQFKLDEQPATIVTSDSYPSAQLTTQLKNGQSIQLYSKIKGARYYLMGFVGNDPQVGKNFFQSLRFDSFNYLNDFSLYQDSTLHFNVSTPVKPPKNLQETHHLQATEATDSSTLALENLYLDFTSSSKEISFNTISGENIMVFLHRFHRYKSFNSIDQIWDIENDLYAPSNHLYDMKKYHTKGWNIYDYKIRDTLDNSRFIQVKLLQKGLLLYHIKTELDSISSTSTFVDTFYTDFSPQESSASAKNLFESKGKYLLADLQNNDTLTQKAAIKCLIQDYEKFQTTNQYTQLYEESFNPPAVFSAEQQRIPNQEYLSLLFTPEDRSTLEDIILHYPFKEEDLNARHRLIEELILCCEEDSYSFIKKLYLDSSTANNLQYAILSSLFRSNSASALRLALHLLEKETALPTDNYALYYDLDPSLLTDENIKILFPFLFSYTSIPEYKQSIVALLASLYSDQKITRSFYRKHLESLLKEAQLEAKRSQTNTKGSYTHASISEYIDLFAPFYKDREEIRHFFSDLLHSNDPYGISYAYFSLKKDDIRFDETPYWSFFKQNISCYYQLLLLFEQQNAMDVKSLASFTDILSKQNIDQRSIAYSYLQHTEKAKNNSRTFNAHYIHSEVIETNSGPLKIFYFELSYINSFSYEAETELCYLVYSADKVTSQHILSGYYNVNISDPKALEKYYTIIQNKTRYHQRERVIFSEDYAHPDYIY